jgi:hypothetical protein
MVQCMGTAIICRYRGLTMELRMSSLDSVIGSILPAATASGRMRRLVIT